MTGFVQHFQLNTELTQTFFTAADALENQAARRTAFDGFHLCGDVCQYTTLSRDIVFIDDAVDSIQHAAEVIHIVRYRVDTDNRITAAVRETFINLCHDTLHFVTGIVRL